LAAESGVTLSQLSLAWILSHPGISSAIVGASKPQQVEENVKAIDINLNHEVLKEIDSILEEIKDFAPRR
jgi:aryl-alcohol dehydrogenase-like predicted oxidoreductase